MNRGWHVEVWGWKICILAKSEHVIWRILRNSASAGEFWMFVRTLDACANFASGNMMSGKFWSNLVSPVDAPPSFPGTLSEIRVHEKTHLHTPRREGMKWDEMKWIVTCGYYVCNMTLLPTLENAWHDMINGKPVLGLAGSHTESRYRFMRPWTLPPHLP